MPKASTRFRNRKINFRTRITIRTGKIDLPPSDHEDELLDDHSHHHHSESSATGQPPRTPLTQPLLTTTPINHHHPHPHRDHQQSTTTSHDHLRKTGLVETGVDKEEEGELHLQKVIEASTLSLLTRSSSSSRPTTVTTTTTNINTANTTTTATTTTTTHLPLPPRCSTSSSPASPSASPSPSPLPASFHPVDDHSKPPLNSPHQLNHVPHIPIPDATGLVEPCTYQALYAHSKLFLPSSYIRFSDTIEDTLGNVLYTLDEEDQLWLSQFNTSNGHPPSSTQINLNSQLLEETAKNRRPAARKGKEKERASSQVEGLGPLTEDDFEALMDHFEKVTDETVPGLHLDTSRLPSLADFEHSLESTLINPRISSIKIFAKFVYSHWKERRLKRGGKPIMPAIDFDESNENNPYVCFRRREIKMVRKTRRTDAQNMDRLIHLRNDLHKAQELLQTVVTRERVKREAVELEKAIFEGRCLIREMKRSLKEGSGDEDLLVTKKEKRRKREESGNGNTKSPSRKPNGIGLNPSSALDLQDIQLLREHARASARLMEREYNRCREDLAGWEDLTDSCHQPVGLSASALRWRSALHSQTASAAKTAKELAGATVDQGPTLAPCALERHQFRKRVGRGGRFLLDRILAPRHRTQPSPPRSHLLSPTSASQQSAQHHRTVDRWRFDDDLTQDFPHAMDPIIVDDYDIPYSSRRRNLLDDSELDCLQPHSDIYLSQASEYLNQVPEPEPPIVKIGKLPGKVVPSLFGIGLGGRTTSPCLAGSSTTSLQDQIMSVHASMGPPHQVAKRLASGSGRENGSPASCSTLRQRRMPNGVSQGASYPTSPQHRHATFGVFPGPAAQTAGGPTPSTTGVS